MVSSSQVGDAISVRCDDTDAVDESAAATRTSVSSDSLETMTSRSSTISLFFRRRKTARAIGASPAQPIGFRKPPFDPLDHLLVRTVDVFAAVSLDVASIGKHVPSAPLVVEKHVENRSQLCL